MINSGPAPLVLYIYIYIYMLLTSGAFFFLLLDKKMALYVSTGIIGSMYRSNYFCCCDYHQKVVRDEGIFYE
jgi:hypothetical protein